MADNVQWLSQEDYGICISILVVEFYPLQAAVMSADNARSREAKLQGQMWNFKYDVSAKSFISRHTSKPETGLYNAAINFHIARKLLVKSHCWCDGECARLKMASIFNWFNYE